MKRVLALAVILFTAKNLYAAEIIAKTPPRISGVQLFVMNPSYKNDTDRFFRELKANGADTVFFRVFNNAGDRTHLGVPNGCPEGGVYFANDSSVCVVDDLLKQVVKTGHKNGVKVFAWMASRSLSFLKTPETMALSFSPDGNPVNGYGANIFHPKVRETLKSLFLTLAQSGVDGILVQDDFIMKYNEGADPLACGAFVKETGGICSKGSFFNISANAGGTLKLTPKKESFEKWAEWKSSELQKLLYEIRSDARLRNPALKWAVNVYYETPVYPEKGLAWYAQDIKGLWSTGVDYIAVMAYQEQIMQEMQLTHTAFLDFAETLGTESLKTCEKKEAVIFKLQVKLFSGDQTQINAGELRLLHDRLTKTGAQSFVELPVNKISDIISTDEMRRSR